MTPTTGESREGTASRRTRRRVAGVLLTGGRSRRMGADKASLVVGGESLARRTARLLAGAADPCVEVGPGRSGLASVTEDPPGSGPLVALLAGDAWLAGAGHAGDVLVVATDLPALRASVLAFLADHGGGGSVVPIVDGRPQPLCARWCRADLEAARRLAAGGERSVRFLAERPGVTLVDPSTWSALAGPDALRDADRPGDLARLSVALDHRDEP